jgi:hypothetical protein
LLLVCRPSGENTLAQAKNICVNSRDLRHPVAASGAHNLLFDTDNISSNLSGGSSTSTWRMNVGFTCRASIAAHDPVLLADIFDTCCLLLLTAGGYKMLTTPPYVSYGLLPGMPSLLSMVRYDFFLLRQPDQSYRTFEQVLGNCGAVAARRGP